MFFTTLFSIDMNFEDLSIFKTRQTLLFRVVDLSDLQNFDKFFLSKIEYKPTLSRCSSHSLLRVEDPAWRVGSHDHLSSLQNL